MTLVLEQHRAILLQLLKDVYSDTSIASHVGFKGGTAALLFYDLPRFSVDLDFDLLEPAKEDVVFEHVGKIVEKYGTVMDAYIKRHNVLHVLSYDVRAQNIKVEINRRVFGSGYETKVLLGIPMLVMLKEDMFAHKLMAMLERMKRTSRDIFDVHFFYSQGWNVNTELLEKRSGTSYQDVLTRCITELEQLDNKHILRGLGELLTVSQKDRTREKLKDDTLFFLRMALDREVRQNRASDAV